MTSVLFAAPRAALILHRDGRLQADGFTARGTTFLEALENWWLAEASRGAAESGPLRFAGSWAL